MKNKNWDKNILCLLIDEAEKFMCKIGYETESKLNDFLRNGGYETEEDFINAERASNY